MLTDATLRNLKPRLAPYKVTDRDGMYALVARTGHVSFRYDYRVNGRRETLVIGAYSSRELTLAQARQKLAEARQVVRRGESPAQAKRNKKRQQSTAKTFCEYAEDWFREADLADSTKAMRRAIYIRDIYPRFQRRHLTEIKEDDVRSLCEKIKARNAPATALHVRELIKAVFEFAALNGQKVTNAAASVAPRSIATFKPRDRALSPFELKLMLQLLEHIRAAAVHRLALRLLLMTLLRKSELVRATWIEVDFESAVWTIPKERMKGRRPHNVYLSRQAAEILVALKLCAGNSPYILPCGNSPTRHIALSSLNKLTKSVVLQAKQKCLSLAPFTLHDLRRTGSTILNEVGFNSDWIEKCLAHEQSQSSRGVYNKAQYAEQRIHMLQEWASMIDAWSSGESYKPELLPPFMRR
jgi:integrase